MCNIEKLISIYTSPYSGETTEMTTLTSLDGKHTRRHASSWFIDLYYNYEHTVLYVLTWAFRPFLSKEIELCGIKEIVALNPQNFDVIDSTFWSSY